MKIETLKQDNKRKYIAGSLVVIAILATITYIGTRAKYRVTNSMQLASGVINYSPSDLELVAIKLQNEAGEYDNTDTVPTSGYELNTTLSVCKIKEEKQDVTIAYEDGKISISDISKKGYKCELYFDKEIGKIQVLAKINNNATSTFPDPANYSPTSLSCTNNATAKFNFDEWLVEIDSVDDTVCTVNFTENINQPLNTYLTTGTKVCSDISSEESTKDCLVNEKGYRYEGSDPNNYVLFNDELWRIIGVFNVTNGDGKQENLVKLIKKDALDSLAWNSSSNDWTNATLKDILNNGYLNGTDTTCSFKSDKIKTCNFSKTGIKMEIRDKIENIVWKIGGVTATTTSLNSIYGAERGSKGANNSTTNLTWTGKVGLMYLSDYGYASLATTCTRSTYLTSYYKCAGKNWLKIYDYEWTITPSSDNAYRVLSIKNNGNLDSYSVAGNGYNVNPSIYLKSSVQVKGGAGTYDLPYLLN